MNKHEFSCTISFLVVILLFQIFIIFGLLFLLITVSESKNKVIYDLREEIAILKEENINE